MRTALINDKKYVMYHFSLADPKHFDLANEIRNSGIDHIQHSFFHIVLVPLGEQSLLFELKFGDRVANYD